MSSRPKFSGKPKGIHLGNVKKRHSIDTLTHGILAALFVCGYSDYDLQRSSKAEFELVPKSESYSFVLREFKLPAFESPWHFHPECELTYIIQGRGKRFVGDSIAPFTPGDLVLIGSNLPHYWRNEAPAKSVRALAHSLVIQFREESLGADFIARPELSGVRSLLLRARRGLDFTGRTAAAVASIMTRMSQASGLQRVIDLLEIFRSLIDSTECRSLSSPGFNPLLDEFASERINRAYKHIFDHFSSRIQHQNIARDAGMSLSAFCHYYKRVTGRTLTDFINEVRVGHATKLLIETDRGIAEIAYQSGFESLSNFNRRFRDICHVSPKEYRQQFLKGNKGGPGRLGLGDPFCSCAGKRRERQD